MNVNPDTHNDAGIKVEIQKTLVSINEITLKM